MARKPFFSRFTKKQLYRFVLVGVSIFLLFILIYAFAKIRIESGALTPNELDRYGLIVAVSIIGTMIGFIIALIPSVQIFLRDIETLKAKGKTDDSKKDKSKNNESKNDDLKNDESKNDESKNDESKNDESKK
jgi:uncharacterized membrane protein YgaE (UPF0421/DUF939 family)